MNDDQLEWNSTPLGRYAPGPAPGWYPTPQGQRYFDGHQWVEPPVGGTELVPLPPLGWALLGAGALAVVGSFMDWATALGGLIGKAGTDGGDGWITVLAGVLIGIMGLLIGVKQGNRAIAAVGAVAALAAAAVAVTDLVDVTDKNLDVGPGLWVVLLASAAGAGVAVAAMFVRIRA